MATASSPYFFPKQVVRYHQRRCYLLCACVGAVGQGGVSVQKYAFGHADQHDDPAPLRTMIGIATPCITTGCYTRDHERIPRRVTLSTISGKIQKGHIRAYDEGTHMRRNPPYNTSESLGRKLFWSSFHTLLKNAHERDIAATDLVKRNRESTAYRILDARISALSEAWYGDLAAMIERSCDAADERAALLACTAQLVQPDGFDGTPEVARAIHVLARNAAEEVFDPGLRAAIIWLLDRVDPARALCAQADEDDDAPATGAKRSGP